MGHGMMGQSISRHFANPTIILCCIIAFLDGADTQSLAIAAPLIARDLAIDPGRLGMIFSASLFGAALGAMGSGILARRLGAKTMLIACTLLFGGFQLATAYVQNDAGLMATRFLAGVGLGGATPCFLALAGGHAAPDARPKLFGIIWAFFPIGGFAGGLFNGWLVQHATWHLMFEIGGLIPVAIAMLVAILAREAPASTANSPIAVPQQSFRGYLMGDRERIRQAIAIASTFFCAFGTLAGVVVWTPSLLVHAGFEPFLGGLILSWHAVGALVSMAAAGFLLTRFGSGILWTGLSFSAALLVIMALHLDSFATVAVVLVLLGIFLGVAASGGVAFVGQQLPNDLQSTGIGWAMAIGRSGQMVLPAVMGWLLVGDDSGRNAILALMMVPFVGAILAWALLRSVHPR